MKLNKVLFVCLLSWISLVAEAQDCDFITQRFDVIAQEGIFYGVDTSFDGRPDSLFLNIYKPDNTVEERPMLIWCFGGGFFTGARSDFDEVSRAMAAAGYVAVTIDYRLGYVTPNILDFPFAYDDKELARAGYRAMQDLKGAIRYMKGRSDLDGIDLDNVFIGGGSAGAIAALAAAFVDLEEEKDLTVLGDLGVTNTVPSYARPDLGPIEGRLHLGLHDASVKGIVNIYGAVLDTALISASDTEVLYSYHQTDDPIVPCQYDKAYHGFPFVPNDMPFAFGSCMIERHMADLNRAPGDIKTYIHDGGQHAIHDDALIFQEVFEFLEYHICGSIVGVDEDDVSTWTAFPNPASDLIYLTDVKSPLRVISALGNHVQLISEAATFINVADWPRGSYFFLDDRGQSRTIVLH